MDTTTRNSNHVMTGDDRRTGLGGTGVGGRQEHSNLPQRGGGYLDVCTKTARGIYEKMLVDNRIDELKEYGLSEMWVEVAEAIGYDQFIHIWQILDKRNIQMGNQDNARMRVPMFTRYMKFQRNKYIYHLSAENLTPKEIQATLKKNLCEDLTVTHIARVLNRGNIK